MSSNKEKYKVICQKKGNQLIIFETYNWLNSLLKKDEWDVSITENKGGDVTGFWPYFIKKKGPFTKLTLPPLTPYLGPNVIYPQGIKDSKKRSFEKQVYNELMAKLPKYDQLVFHMNPTITNWLPFHWRGFEQTTQYTYTISPHPIENIHNALRSNIRREIKKAKKNLKLKEVENIELLHKLKLLDYAAKKKSLTYDLKYMKRLFDCSNPNNKVIEAVNEYGETIGATLFIWDNHFLYYLVGAVDPKHKNAGSMSLMLWKGIELANKMNLTFNFEGSMIESIERFFSSFGSEQTPYLRIEKTPNKLLKVFNAINR